MKCVSISWYCMIMGWCNKGCEVSIYIMVLYDGMIMGLCYNKGYEVCIIWHLLFMLPFEGSSRNSFPLLVTFTPRLR